ncbi:MULTISPECIES: phage portal protein [unclassified Chelatococcus]|uniref:phage portal protein n=1 Tax=unclassified Chelatococcus TaxID=2638111 RepID=UPI001BCBB198|nr:MULTISPECIES: phage portal protein [unclassified Chelatococcus]CAH1670695.1 Phage portal protein [Hyphomicrobiales bacterium]MBS7738369.1 phage portal protein [Chelatococcus sp. HY11]MBX3545897.1 phage portal protein [Chelatococcus sp.]MCO5077285.1 phage portal protein [Chelatococcus sp.]CAH1677072.1 Phage portal protein [Hyphomicrobiales bacterium]
MGFWGRISAAAFGASQGVSDDGHWILRVVGGGKTKSGVSVAEMTARNLPSVYACVNRISNPLARFPLKILRRSKTGGAEEVLDHPLSGRLGVRPNDFMSSRTLRKTTQGHALLWGNGYIEIERNGAGQAVNLWPLMPDRTRPIREDGRLFYRTSIGGRSFDIDHENVIHIMDQSHDGYVGLSQVAIARQAIGMGLAMEEFGAKFFANDAKSGGFLLHPGKLGAQARANMGLSTDRRSDPGADLERQGGLDNAHRVKVLEEGMKFIQTTIPPEDAQFLGSREFQIAEVARIYDVPLVLLQSHEKSTSWGSGIEQLMIGFVRQTIDPWADAWEQELNWKLFTEQERAAGYYVKFNMNAILRGDMAARAAFYREMFSVAGLTPNQICALEDMDPIGPDGDTRFVPSNFTTLERAINPPDPPPLAPAVGAPHGTEADSERDAA